MAIQRVYVRLGGGLGDVVQNLLSTEVADIQEPGYLNIDIPPASVPASSRWFCRLKDFKKKHPGVCVIAACMCHNPGAKDLFEYNPLVDEVKMIHWVMPKDMVDNVFEDATDAVDINSLFDYKDYEKDSNDRIFLSNAEKLPAIAFCQIMPYIVIHPFAGHKGRELYPLDLYADVIDKLIDEYGYRVFVIGKSYKTGVADKHSHQRDESFSYTRHGLYNVVDRYSAALNIKVIFGASGMIGTYSSMLLSSWYRKIPSVCMAPPKYGEDFLEYAGTKRPLTFGLLEDYSTVIIIDKDAPPSPDIVVSELLNVIESNNGGEE